MLEVNFPNSYGRCKNNYATWRDDKYNINLLKESKNKNRWIKYTFSNTF